MIGDPGAVPAVRIVFALQVRVNIQFFPRTRIDGRSFVRDDSLSVIYGQHNEYTDNGTDETANDEKDDFLQYTATALAVDFLHDEI